MNADTKKQFLSTLFNAAIVGAAMFGGKDVSRKALPFAQQTGLIDGVNSLIFNSDHPAVTTVANQLQAKDDNNAALNSQITALNAEIAELKQQNSLLVQMFQAMQAQKQ